MHAKEKEERRGGVVSTASVALAACSVQNVQWVYSLSPRVRRFYLLPLATRYRAAPIGAAYRTYLLPASPPLPLRVYAHIYM